MSILSRDQHAEGGLHGRGEEAASKRLQGDQSGCFLGAVDVKTKVTFKYTEHIQRPSKWLVRGLVKFFPAVA